MKKSVIMLAFLAMGVAPQYLHAQAKFVQKVEKKNAEIVIPFEKYVLPNGLTVILHEDKSDPVVHVDVTYHVGSAREELGKSGFAHFFEHMMFQGSDNVADEAHFKVITEAGGTLNGTTNRDRTNYFETVPKNQLEKMLWLEADRMGFLLDAVTQEKFEIQRATVKNERGQRYDNVPYGLMSEVASKNLYPHGHPYSWLTIGYVEDLNRVNVNDLKNFFLRWYGPNNAVLTIGGDFDKKQVLDWIHKYFGSIPRGVEVTPAKFPIPVLESNRFVTMEDNYAKVNKLRMVYPTPARYSKEEPYLDLVAQVLGQGKSSILYKNLVKAGLASSVQVYNYAAELSGEFTIDVTPFPGKSLAEIHNVILKSIDELSTRGINKDDIEKFVSSTESQLIYGLESVNGKVSMLAANYTFTGDANYLAKELEAYRNIDAKTTMDMFKQYIHGKNSLTLSVVTKDDLKNEVRPTNYTVDTTKGYLDIDYGYDGLTYNKAKDNFDRSKMPEAGLNPVFKAPKYYTGKVAQSLNLIGTYTDEIPVVTTIIKLKGGSNIDPKDKVGLASLFATMMNEDTKKYSAEQMSDELEKLGSSISISAQNEDINIQVRSLKKNLDATLALLQERLMNPVFNQEDFDRNKKRMIENIKNATNRPNYIASVIYQSLQYDNNAPYSFNASEATVNNITLKDIEQYYKNNFSRNNGSIIVVGEINEKEVANKFDFLKKLNNNIVALPKKDQIAKVNANTLTKGVVYVVDFPNAAQTEFRLGKVTGQTYDFKGDYYLSHVSNYALGGAFNSRLNLYLREEKGWTYGARSSASADKYTGDYSFSAGIKADPTDSALVDVIRIIEEFRKNGITAEELTFTKNALTNNEALKYETGYQKAGFLSGIQTYNLPANFKEQQQTYLNQLTTQQVNQKASTLIPATDDYIILLVGDKAKIASKVEAKGFKVIELDKQGNIVK